MTAIRESVYRTVARRGGAVAFSAVLAIGLGAISTRAQTSHDDDRNTTGSEHLTLSAAYNGYWGGFARGAEDLKRGPDVKTQADETFLRAETGYTPDMGTFANYQSAFRQAYARGYADGHSGCDRDPLMNVPPAPPEPGDRSELYHQRADGPGGNSLGVASAKGYDAGYTQGTEDKRHGGSYGYRDEDIYRAATDGYYPSLGDEGRYQVVFRQIYTRGYSDGFSGRERYTETPVQADDPCDPVGQTPPITSRSVILRIANVSGYDEGFEHGTSDRNAHQSFGYRHDGIYQRATAGYDPGWNIERDYQTTFRQGYAAGYKAAYYGRARNQSREDRFDAVNGRIDRDVHV